MAGGFRFMPLGLVRLRTFRLSTWVSSVQTWCRCYRVHAQSGRVTQRCHNNPRWGTGWRSANDAPHRKRAEDYEDFEEKLGELKPRRRTRRFDFWSSRDEFARYGRRARWGPDEKDGIERLCLSPYVEEPFNSKVIKGSYLNWEVVTCFSNFEIPMLYLNEHLMCVSHIAYHGHGTTRPDTTGWEMWYTGNITRD